MKTDTLRYLFGADVMVTDMMRVDVNALAHSAVGRIVIAPPQEITVIDICGRVAAVRVIPQIIRDPVIPVCLCEMPEMHWWAMRRYWTRLLPAVRGEFCTMGRARRAARVVARTLETLHKSERQFFLVHLWSAFNGEA